ncbi:hypothetical protein ACFX10_013280 [Malus domestica]
MCFALVFVVQKHRHYMHAYIIHLVTKTDPIIYVPTKAIKGQALVEFLTDHPIPTNWKISDNLLDEEVVYVDIFSTWTMFFDASARADRAGVGIVFMSP